MDIRESGKKETQRAESAYCDDVIPHLDDWMLAGERCALITLIGVDGNAPRAEGAQMAVSESGRWAGYISGGCLEQAMALEAVETIKAGTPRLLRYGKGSPYFDIRLPCGSGLDVFIQPLNDLELIHEMRERMGRREPFALRIGLDAGTCNLQAPPDLSLCGLISQRRDDEFVRVYTPRLRCLVIGSSPIAVSLSELAVQAGFETDFFAQNAEALPELRPGVNVHQLMPRTNLPCDPWTAAALAFHDHEQEMPVFAELLRSPCFFITAIGSRNAHTARKLALADAGFSENEISRVESPAGLVPGLKSASLVALSILAQIVSAAQKARLLV